MNLSTIRVNENNTWEFDKIVEGNDFIAQDVKTKLLQKRDEYYLGLNEGIDYDYFWETNDTDILLEQIEEVLLKIEGITAINNLSANVISHTLQIAITYTTFTNDTFNSIITI